LASGFDIAEAFTPPPMTNIGLPEARALWGDRITIWGGIASTMMSLSVPAEEFEAHVHQVLKQAAPGDHFILGTGDNVPTDSSLERVQRVTELVEELGDYPLKEERL
jgi:uroporphyrinogen-III decarboxylase